MKKSSSYRVAAQGLSSGRLFHYLTFLMIAVLAAIPYANKGMILTVYEALQPLTSFISNIFFLSELYGRASNNPNETTAYATLACLAFLVLYINFILFIRKELTARFVLSEDIHISWCAYLCRFFYSRLTPSFSLHCYMDPKQRVQLTRGMTHRDVIRKFLSTRAASVKENYFTAVLVYFVFLSLYWIDDKPEMYFFIPHHAIVMLFVFFKVYLITELFLLATVYFASYKKEKGQ